MRHLWVLFFLLMGCDMVPRPPDSSKYPNLAPASERFELYQTSHSHRRVNALFVAADETIQQNFSSAMSDAYKNRETPRLEELVWWRYLPYLDDVYGTIVRIDHEQLDYRNLASAIEYLEGLGEAYDVILLSHGFHNHLTDGAGNYFLSWQELAVWKGKLEHLQMVFMQGCFSSTLAQDWLDTGADYVLSYEGLNRNFFYPEPFLSFYAGNATIPDIVENLNSEALAYYFEDRHLYYEIARALGYEDMGDYLEETPGPQIFVTP